MSEVKRSEPWAVGSIVGWRKGGREHYKILSSALSAEGKWVYFIAKDGFVFIGSAWQCDLKLISSPVNQPFAVGSDVVVNVNGNVWKILASFWDKEISQYGYVLKIKDRKYPSLDMFIAKHSALSLFVTPVAPDHSGYFFVKLIHGRVEWVIGKYDINTKEWTFSGNDVAFKDSVITELGEEIRFPSLW